MADFSVDSLGKTVASSLKGVKSTVAGTTSNKLLGSAATAAGKTGNGLISGATRAVEGQLAGYVGGAENLKALKGAATQVKGTISSLINGKTSVADLYGEAKGAVSDLFGEAKDGATALYGEAKGAISSLFDTDEVGTVEGSAEGFLCCIPIAANDLGSDWGRLSKLLVARLYVCDSKGVADIAEFEGVYGPLVEGTFESTQNWQSAFENTGPETKAPTLTAMLQSGSAVPVLNALQAVNPVKDGAIGQMIDTSADKLKTAVRELEGRTGLTKLNSRQVFSGMPPVRMNFSIEFRAFHDALQEVEAPLQRLLEWVFPQELAEDGILSEVMQTARDLDSFIKALFPSKAPKLLALTYAGRTYAPMVVESITFPLDAPKDSNGNYISLAVQVNLATLTALDRADIKRFFSRI